MGTAFATAAATLLEDPNLGADGTFTPAGGDPVALRVHLQTRDPAVGTFETGWRNAAWKATILQGAVAAKPADGDVLTVAGIDYVVRDVRADPVSVTWDLDVDAA